MTIQEKLRKIRLDRELSIQNMAADLGISHQQYSNIESGKTDLGWSRLLQIAGVFKLDVIEIVIYGEEAEELNFVKSKIKLHQDLAAATTENMVLWRNQAITLAEQIINMQEEKDELKAELEKVKKTSKLSSTDLLMAAELETKYKTKHKAK